MKISYIPPVSPIAETTNSLPFAMPSNIISNAIEQAIHHAIIDPAKAWLWKTSVKILLIAEWGCIIGCAIGIVMLIVGLRSGSKVSKVCFLTHFGLQIVKVVLL